MQNERMLFFLLALTNETLATQHGTCPDGEHVHAEEARRKLFEVLFAVATISTEVGTHAWRAKMHIVRRVFRAQFCDARGNLPPDTNLLNTLIWSVLEDAA